MIKEGTVVALGSAYVEGKIQSSQIHLPTKRVELPTFLEAHPEADLYAGGSIPNILTSFVRMSSHPHTQLLSCIGNDPRGRFYLENMDRRLGEPQVARRRPTDIWVGIYNNGLVEGMDRYGAVTELSVPRERLHYSKISAFITDVDVCRFPIVRDQVKQVIDMVDDGLFVLSLVGASARGNIQKALSFTDRTPDIVFGNTGELLAISGETNMDKAIMTAFPQSKLLVVTQAERGALVRFRGQVFSVPTEVVLKERVVDDTGAGDSYMGTMLALLWRRNYKEWTEKEIINAAKIASYAAALVVQSMNSRITPAMARTVRSYESHLLNS